MTFENNPFATIGVSPAVMQAFVVVMIVFVVSGTLFDLAHKRSARYFFEHARRAKGHRDVPIGEMISLALKTVLVDWLAAGEFCNTRRRLAHLFVMYGFLAYVASTVVLVFGYPTSVAPPLWPELWHAGALLICIGGFWFWFFIRVDVTAEGHSPFRVVRADLFILSLLANALLALISSYMQAIGSRASNIALGFYVVSAAVLFGTIPWSKFSHMFYKPAAAFQKRMGDANGSRANLPLPADKSPTLGISRTRPSHY
jgi:hypothetical protein